MATAIEAVSALRELDIPIGVVTNESGVARGLLTAADVDAVNAKVEALLGPFDVWRVCPHAEADRCACRKPAPGMLHSACAELGVPPTEVAMIGDIGADMAAAHAAGMRGVMVPTPATRTAEVESASEVAPTVLAAVRRLLAEGGADVAA